MITKKQNRLKRHKRIRAKVFGTSIVPRISVFKSNKYIYAQLIDDDGRHTLAAASELDFTPDNSKKIDKSKMAYEVGKKIAKLAKDIKIERAVFDRGGYKYHGHVKALADGVREGGLKI